MGIDLNEIIPLGRSYTEYVRMFGLDEIGEPVSILDCGGGPSSFNSCMSRKGNFVVSIDPIYEFNKVDIEKRINETFNDIINQAGKNKDKFVWDSIGSVAELEMMRRSSMDEFLSDFEKGKKNCRYISADVTGLPFKNNQFELALSSHFLFLYESILSYGFHLNAITEMLRVADEARVFPLVDLNIDRCSYVDKIISKFEQKNYLTSIVKVDYEFQKGGNQYLKIMRA